MAQLITTVREKHLLVQTPIGGIKMQVATAAHSLAVILLLALKLQMTDNVVWHLFFMDCCGG